MNIGKIMVVEDSELLHRFASVRNFEAICQGIPDCELPHNSLS
jgi:hypothetical protein